MSVLEVIEKDRTGASYNRQKERTYSRFFWVRVTPGTSDATILTHPSIPKPYDPHPEDARALVDNVNADRENGRLFSVDVTYSTTIDRDEDPENPLNRPAKISFSTSTERVPITVDRDGAPLLNTAGDLLTGIEEDRVLWQITVQKNVAAVPRWLLTYQNATNQDPVRIRGITFPKETLLVSGIEIPEPSIENNTEFVPLTLRLLFRQETWVQLVLNFGLRERRRLFDTSTQEFYEDLVPIYVSGVPTDEPLPLDENGRAYRETNDVGLEVIKKDIDPAEIKRNMRRFSTKQKLPFSALPLR